jgi:quinol-cytochrome oxidoreductase complex cytochrome b subunit
VRANPLQTPLEIVPEWYLLPYYAILRSVPDIAIPFTGIVLMEAKLAGVIAMFGSIFILFALPWLDFCQVRSARYRPITKQLFWIFLAVCVVLGWVGANKPEGVPLLVGQVCTAYYFAHFLIIIPLLAKFEKIRPLPESISEPVLKGSNGVGE